MTQNPMRQQTVSPLLAQMQRSVYMEFSDMSYSIPCPTLCMALPFPSFWQPIKLSAPWEHRQAAAVTGNLMGPTSVWALMATEMSPTTYMPRKRTPWYLQMWPCSENHVKGNSSRLECCHTWMVEDPVVLTHVTKCVGIGCVHPVYRHVSRPEEQSHLWIS